MGKMKIYLHIWQSPNCLHNTCPSVSVSIYKLTFFAFVQEEFMNNCAVRTGLSAVMGMGLGAMFGVAMGTFDTAVSIL